LRAKAPAVLQQIASVSRYERNDEVEPKHVVPVESTAKVSGNAVSVVLPHDSVMVIHVPVQ
jgi:hypothetical protein